MYDFSSHYISFAKRMRNEHPWLWRLMCKLVEPLRFKGWSFEKCEEILNKVHPDIHSTSLASNPPSTNEVDLQIIVPVYNVERTLAECLDSILSQETKYSFMVTIVNDGSPDNSLAIARRYEADSRVQIICQENRGLSGARNAALRQMSGKYVLFVDSDDRLAPGAIENLMDATYEHQDMDIIVGGYNEIDLVGRYIKTIHTNTAFPEDNPIGYPWGKVMKSTIWEDLQWPEGYWFEDVLVPLVLYVKYRVGSISEIVYEYRINPNGIVGKSWGNPKTIDTFYITRQLVKEYKDLCDSERFQNAVVDAFVLNRGRMETFGNSCVSEAVFYLECHLYSETFRERNKLEDMDRLVLRHKNFIHFSIV